MYAINVYDKISNVNRSCAANELHLIAAAVRMLFFFGILMSADLLFLFVIPFWISHFHSGRLLVLIKSTTDELIGLCYNNEH